MFSTLLLEKWDAKKRKRLYAYAFDQYFTIAGVTYRVPAFFWFDGSTTQRPFWGVFCPTGITFPAGSLHDFLYETKGRGLNGEYNLSREEVDWLFFLHMLQDNTPQLQAQLMYLGVRTPIGGLYWKRDNFPNYLKDPEYYKAVLLQIRVQQQLSAVLF